MLTEETPSKNVINLWGTGLVLHCLFFWQNSVMSGIWWAVSEVLKVIHWSILISDMGFQFFNSLGSLCHIFRFKLCQMFSMGDRSGQQAGTFLLQSHTVGISGVCDLALSYWIKEVLPFKRYCCSKTCKYCLAFVVPSQTSYPSHVH